MENHWLLKTEPNKFSWEDLRREGKTVWDGVKAPAALVNLSQMRPKDLTFIYHTGKERAVVGIAEVTGLPYPDPALEVGRFLVINLAPREALACSVTLKQIKDSGLFPGWDLVRLPRLSVVPVSKEQWEKVIEWSKS